MTSIVTITFNPAVDTCTSIPVLNPHHKMRCASPAYYPGGGGVNVARAMKKLGGNALAVYLAGGFVGKTFEQLMFAAGVESLVIEISENTRENLIIQETGTGLQYRFGMPGPYVQEKEWRDCLSSVERLEDMQYIVASGSLPPGIPTDIFARIASIARKKNARLIVDTSGEALQQALQEGVYLIKPSLSELSSLVGKTPLPAEEVEELARNIVGKGNSEIVVVSMGESGAMMVSREGSIKVIPPVVKILSTVGAGDSMVAGLVMGLSLNRNKLEILQYGVACGSAATMQEGTNLCKKEDADRLFEQIRKKLPEHKTGEMTC
jgi:6-phosphofructokinase 2